MAEKSPGRVAAGKKLAAKIWHRCCLGCLRPFDGTAKQIFCSRKCKERAAKVDRSGIRCHRCGVAIAANPLGQRPKFCSSKCKNARPLRTRACVVCHHAFSSRSRTLTCSLSCRRILSAESRILTRHPEIAAAKLGARS